MVSIVASLPHCHVRGFSILPAFIRFSVISVFGTAQHPRNFHLGVVSTNVMVFFKSFGFVGKAVIKETVEKADFVAAPIVSWLSQG